MNTLLGSASRLHRSLRCVASELLPHDGERSERAEKAANRGTEIHRFVELRGKGASHTEACAQVSPKHQKTYDQIDMDSLAAMVPGAIHEIAFVYRGKTGTVDVVADQDGHRDYGEVGPLDVPGTADVVIRGFRNFEVYDLKTGRADIPLPDQNEQLLHLALCVYKALCQRATQGILGIQRLRSYGRIETTTARVDPYVLEDYEARLQQSLRLAQRAQVDPVRHINPGEHCLYCPAYQACPAEKGTR